MGAIWIKVTLNNFNNWSSLPKRFTIKRSWNRYSSVPIDTYPKDVPGTTMGRFLARISFHYIPAVRGRGIFSHYLNLLHDSLIDDERAGVRNASERLIASINDSTVDMADRIREGLGFESSIQVPDNLKELFEALDFSTGFASFTIPLQKRGDGIQARHIPFILDFISRHSRKDHIWAYEEPENSLELSGAFELAAQFDSQFSKRNQIVLSTHSPAFYDLSGGHVSKWLVQMDNAGPGGEPVTTATLVSETEAADRNLGIAALVAERSYTRKLVTR